tara:strand:+ start:427 stop:675 length:249 start_codon:yes stop_codon:yes gene_type:complete
MTTTLTREQIVIKTLQRLRKCKFGMFSKKGNLAINRIVKSSSSYKQALTKMKELTEFYPEATDTDVRDSVFVYFENKNKTLN